MSTYASRPAWSLKARAITSAWVIVPVGLGALVALSLLLRTTELGIGFWIDEGLSVGIADRPLGDIPLALREDGSPPLYYMLLHFWLDVGGRSEAGVRGLSLLFALLAIPAALLGRPHDLGDDEGGLVRRRPDGLQPVPGAVRAGGADVLAGGAAGDPGHDLLREGLRAGHRAPAPVDRGLRGVGRRRPVHAQLADLLHRQRRRGLGAAVVAGGQAAPQAVAARRPARLRRARDPLPAVGADDALPGRPHRRPVGGRAGLQLAARRARRPARQHAADRPADLRRRRPGGAAAAAARRARPRRRRPDHPRRADAHDRLDDVAGLTGVGEPLPGRRAAAVPAARRGRARARAPARASSAWCWW